VFTTDTLATALADRYTIERLIGEGGMARVFLARDLRHNRRVALKVLRPDLGAVVGVERFQAEIEVTANLQHPNLLPLFDSGEAGDLLFYVMPYVEGESLRARIDREKQLPVDEAVRIAIAVASALDYAHRHGVIHRDLKPENILLHDGQPLVADFGIALAISKASGARITQTGISLGTPQYMSPEQATGDRLIDSRTDIYSLGAVTYEMLTGEPPHAGSTSQAVIARVLTEKPRSVRASRPSVSPQTEAAVERSLEKLPADRWATAREFGEALAGARPIAQSYVRAAAPATATVALSRTRNAREIAAWVLAAAGLAVAALLATRRATPSVPSSFVVELPDSVVPGSNSAYAEALSPDGTQLAVVGEKQGHAAIYLRRLDDPVFQLVRGTEGTVAYPSFSPDGRSLLFYSAGKLKTVPTAGGTPRIIADGARNSVASWGSDGRVVYVARTSLYSVSSDGGNKRLIAQADTAHGRMYYSSPSVLPESQYALTSVWRLGGGIDSAEIDLVSLRNGKWIDLGIRGVWVQYDGNGHVLFGRANGQVMAAPFSVRRQAITGPSVLVLENVRQAPLGATGYSVAANGTLVYQSADEGGQQAMYVVDRRGTERRLKGPAQAFQEPRVSPDGRRVVVTAGAGSGGGRIWVYDMGPGTLSPFTGDSGYMRAEWTSDGSHVIYIQQGAEADYLLSRPWDASSPPTILTRTSRGLLYDVSVGKPHELSALGRGMVPFAHIWLAPTDSFAAMRSFTTGATEVTPRVSPNGKLLAYASRESEGEYQVYLTPIPGPGPHVQVSVDGGKEPVWSHDGTTLFYRGPTRLMGATIAEHPSPEVTRRDSFFVDVYHKYTPRTQYDVLPNGNEFLMIRGTVSRSSIYAIVNWPELARVRGASPENR
jgi:serine/threonine-protein kinase